MPTPGKKRRFSGEFYELIGYSAVGLEMGFAVAIGALVGYYLDEHFETTKPWLTMLFLFFGIGAAGKALWRTYYQMKKKLEEQNRDQRP